MVKLLYYIDKIHLIEYGRFVTNDTYIKLPYGPVPTKTLDIINSKSNLFEDEKKYIFKYLSFSNDNTRTITSKTEPDLNELSKSEIAVIDSVIKDYGKYPANKLVDLIHQENAYKKAGNHDCISILDIIADLPDDRKTELLEIIQEDSETNQILHDFKLC